MSSVLPASGFRTEERSQESQKTMKGNCSATLNELSFKEVFIHPQQIHTAESDWLVFISKIIERARNKERVTVCNGWEKEQFKLKWLPQETRIQV